MARFCSTRTTVSSRFIARSASTRCSTTIGARPLDGSSIRSSRFGLTRARAMASICFWPPESVAAPGAPEAAEVGEQLEDAPEAVGRRGVERPLGDAEVLVHRERRRRCPGPRARSRSRAARPGGAGARRWARPSNRTSPRRAAIRPITVRSVVVLPAPLRPRSTVTASRRDAERHALEDVVLPDVGVDVPELEERRVRAGPASRAHPARRAPPK